MSRTTDLLPFKLRNIEQLRREARRRTMRLWVGATIIVILAALTISIVYELQFCTSFPRAQSCGWAHTLGVIKP